MWDALLHMLLDRLIHPHEDSRCGEDTCDAHQGSCLQSLHAGAANIADHTIERIAHDDNALCFVVLLCVVSYTRVEQSSPARLPNTPLYSALFPPAFHRALMDFSEVAVCSLVFMVSSGYRTARDTHPH